MKLKRRHLLSGLLGLLAGVEAVARKQSVFAASSNIIEVKTVEEFFRAIGSNRTIKLTAPKYNLSELSPELQWANTAMRETYDGYELIISGVENLRIESSGSQLSLMVVEPTYAAVLNFQNCRNITISKLEAGHWPEKGTCSGSVITLWDCENVGIDKSVLYGCGSYGVTAYNTQNISIKASVIKECTYGIVSLKTVRNFTAEKCRFYNNKGILSFVDIMYSPGLVAFKNCEFYDNSIEEYGGEIKGNFFEGQESQPILVEDCLIRNNRVSSLSNESNFVKLINTKLENNSFR